MSHLDAAAIREAHVILQKFPSTSPTPHYIVFREFLINFSMITLLCLTFFPVYSREIKLLHNMLHNMLIITLHNGKSLYLQWPKK